MNGYTVAFVGLAVFFSLLAVFLRKTTTSEATVLILLGLAFFALVCAAGSTPPSS